MVAPISADLAEPFEREYCARFGLPYARASRTSWLGSLDSGKVVAVLGLALWGDILFVEGLYGERKGILELWNWGSENCPKLAGIVHHENRGMLNLVRRRGWAVAQHEPTCYWVKNYG